MHTSSPLIEMLRLYGLQEVDGPASQPELLAILQAHLPSADDDSKTAWCGIAMAEAFRRAGLLAYVPARYMAARSWLDLPHKVTLDDARPGDVVIFWRGSPESWQGHVAIFIARRGANVYVLGGNQANSVRISPYAADRVLGIRRITAADGA